MNPIQKSRAACLIISRAADTSTPEGQLWCAVLKTVAQDYFFWPLVHIYTNGIRTLERRRPKQDRMRRYMQSRDFEAVCGYAGLHPEFVEDVIATLELHELSQPQPA